MSAQPHWGTARPLFRELLRRLFHYYGFSGGETDDASGFLLRKGSLAIEIVPVDDVTEMGEEALAGILAKKTPATRRIVISLGRFSEGACRMAESERVQLWDRTRLEEEAGRMVLAEIDTREAPSADESILEPFLKGELERQGGPPADATAETVSLPEIPGGEGQVLPEISQEKAGTIVADRLEGILRFDLQMMPHYCFAYRCDLEGAHGKHATAEGVVLVNSIGGEAFEWRLAKLHPMLDTSIRMEPSIERVQAEGIARARVVAAKTRVVHLKREKGSVTIYEKMTLSPSPDAVRLDFRGMVFLPVWCIEGGNGAVVLDATGGRVVKQEFFDKSGPGRENGSSK